MHASRFTARETLFRIFPNEWAWMRLNFANAASNSQVASEIRSDIGQIFRQRRGKIRLTGPRYSAVLLISRRLSSAPQPPWPDPGRIQAGSRLESGSIRGRVIDAGSSSPNEEFWFRGKEALMKMASSFRLGVRVDLSFHIMDE